MPWVASLLLLGAPLPGQLDVGGGPGIVLGPAPRLQLLAGAEWYPFAITSGGGLADTGCAAYTTVDAAATGAASLMLGVGFGRPRTSLWFSFQALGAVVVGWREARPKVRAMVAPVGSLRLGYGPLALRGLVFVSASPDVLNQEHYRLSVELTW